MAEIDIDKVIQTEENLDKETLFVVSQTFKDALRLQRVDLDC